MTTERQNTVVNEESNRVNHKKHNENKISRHTGEIISGGAQGKAHHHILLGLVLFVALSLVILSVDEDPQTLADSPVSDGATTIAVTESATVEQEVQQEFSPPGAGRFSD